MLEFSDCRGGGTREPWPPTTCNDVVSVMVDFTRMVSDNVITFVIKWA